jgi:hypothetical protein
MKGKLSVFSEYPRSPISVFDAGQCISDQTWPWVKMMEVGSFV